MTGVRSMLFSPDAERARVLAAPLCAEGFAPVLRIVDDGAVTEALLIEARHATIVFLDLAMGISRAVALCRGICARPEAVPPLLAMLGEPTDAEADELIAGGANMYFPSEPTTLARRTRFLRPAVGRRADFRSTIARLEASEVRRRQLELAHRELLECAPSAVVVHRDDRIAWVTQHAVELFGVDSPAELIGRQVIELVPEESREVLSRRLRARMAGRDEGPVEWRILGRGGQLVPVSVIGMPVIFEGEPAGMVFIRDLTDQRRLETQLIATERMASLGRLAASVGHEINNPLTYVLGNLELAQRSVRRGPGDSELGEMLAGALAGAEQVQRIVDDLRVFSQRSAETVGPVDVRALLESCIRLTAGELRHRASIESAFDDVPAVLANRPRLAQVITNLLLNAGQAFPDGASDRHRIIVAAEVVGNQLELRVEDTGEGIAPEHLPHVFEPFFTTRTDRGGTGLGLSICKMLVAEQGGELSLTSTPGAGTCVRVRLPLADTQDELAADRATRASPPQVAGRELSAQPAQTVDRAQAAQAADPELAAVTPRRVLLVDDEPLIAKVLRESLHPHQVTVASSGIQALGHLTAGETFDAIVCDLMMPELGGVDVHERITVDHPGLEHRMVFMTGGAFTPRATSFLARVNNPCLEKPFAMTQLFEAIELVASRK